jgi:hypothetical protein
MTDVSEELVDKAAGCTIAVRFSVGSGTSFRHRVHTGSWAHPASYPMDIGGSILGGK